MPDQSDPTGNRGHFAPLDELGLLSRHRALDVPGSSVNQAFSRSHYPSFNAPDGTFNAPDRFSKPSDASYSFPDDQFVAPDTSFNVAEASQVPGQYQHDSRQQQFAGRRDQSGPLAANRQQQWITANGLAPANQQPVLNERPSAHGHQQLFQAFNSQPQTGAYPLSITNPHSSTGASQLYTPTPQTSTSAYQPSTSNPQLPNGVDPMYMPNPQTFTSAYQPPIHNPQPPTSAYLPSIHNPQPPAATFQPTTPGPQAPSGQIERSFRCLYCPWSFDRKDTLIAHVLDIHLGREHRCTYCNKKLSSKGSRIRHEKTTCHLRPGGVDPPSDL